MKILVQNKTIETKEIVDIVELPGSHQSGFKIYMIDGINHIFEERHGYDTPVYIKRESNERWRKLRLSVKSKWDEDKHELPTFKL